MAEDVRGVEDGAILASSAFCLPSHIPCPRRAGLGFGVALSLSDLHRLWRCNGFDEVPCLGAYLCLVTGSDLERHHTKLPL